MSAYVESSPVAAVPVMQKSLSIYIPEVKVEYTMQVISMTMSYYGVLERIDILPRKNFITKEIDPVYKRVYVHFSAIYDIDIVRHMLNNFEFHNKHLVEFDVYQPGNKESWVVYPAKNKLPYTEMNIHQLANTCNILDDKVIDLEQNEFRQNALIEQLQEKNDMLEAMMREMQKTMIEMQRHMKMI